MLDFTSGPYIIIVAFLGGLGKAPTFLVPIINPPFADNSPHLFSTQFFQILFFIAFSSGLFGRNAFIKTLSADARIFRTGADVWTVAG